MKKLLTITLMLVTLILTGCTTSKEVVTEKTTTAEHNSYVAHGRYYMNADLQWEVTTDDGNIWIYDQSIISNKPRYHAEPVYVCFDDNGTPDNIYDDIILGLVLDRETAIYDELEDALSESFELERSDNHIRIQGFTNIRTQQLEEVK